MRQLARIVVSDDGQIEVTVARFADKATRDKLAKELAETVVRAFEPDVLREFLQSNAPTRGTH